MVKALLASKADPSTRDQYGSTPVQWAREAGHQQAHAPGCLDLTRPADCIVPPGGRDFAAIKHRCCALRTESCIRVLSSRHCHRRPYCNQNPYSLEPSPGGAYAGDYANDPASEGPHWPTTRASPQASLARRSRDSPSKELALINVRAHKESKAKTHSDAALERSLQRLEVVQARLKEGPQIRSPEKRSPPRHMGGPWVVPPPQKEQFLEKLSPVVAKWAKTAGLREVTPKHMPSEL